MNGFSSVFPDAGTVTVVDGETGGVAANTRN